ncbi:DUF6364 family protein [Buttiauxella gaviniae]|uniref:DUF6364 family protein n=1 Tax=Buttiauxella gaviniae TaxID=82990 RepID=UPI003C77A313
MTVKQLTLRFTEAIIERLKSTAKQENISVNNLVERYLINGLDSESSDQADYSRMKSEPFTPLSHLYHLLSDNISDSVYNDQKVLISPAEVRFVANGALEEIKRRCIQLPWYIDTKEIAERSIKSEVIQFDHMERLFPFALCHYLKNRADRAAFAAQNTPDTIRSVTKEYQTGNVSLRLSIEGTLRNRMAPKELRVSPLVRLDIEGEYFSVMLGWDKYIATLRLLRYLESESWTKASPIISGVSFSPADKNEFWRMRVDETDITLSETELFNICKWLLYDVGLVSVINTVIRLNGE